MVCVGMVRAQKFKELSTKHTHVTQRLINLSEAKRWKGVSPAEWYRGVAVRRVSRTTMVRGAGEWPYDVLLYARRVQVSPVQDSNGSPPWPAPAAVYKAQYGCLERHLHIFGRRKVRRGRGGWTVDNAMNNYAFNGSCRVGCRKS